MFKKLFKITLLLSITVALSVSNKSTFAAQSTSIAKQGISATDTSGQAVLLRWEHLRAGKSTFSCFGIVFATSYIRI